MGYTHITGICQFIPPAMIQKTAGTWTPTETANIIMDVRTAADASFDLFVPLNLPGATNGKQGAKLASVDFWYKIATAAADDFATVEILKMALPVDGAAPTATAPTVTIDTDHDTAAERLAVDEHKMTVTLATPAFIEDDEAYYLHLVIDAAATTVFTIWGAQVNFTLRL